MNFEESLRYMEGLIRFGWKLDLERIETLCARLGDPQRRYSVLHVTGTKGKGSTTALAAGILQAAGYRVGSYFSPYVYDVRERIQINGAPIPKADFARLVSLVRPHIEAITPTELGQTTEFELKTLVGFLYFAEQQVDYACIEVGIGGRLDATNVVLPTVTVITNIGLDHTHILGDTYAQIAGEKAGILKQAIPCFTATENLEALEKIQQVAQAREVPLTHVVQTPLPTAWERGQGGEGIVSWSVDVREEHTAPVTIRTPAHTYKAVPMAMGGVYQRSNAACAVAAVESMLAAHGRTLPEAAVREGLAQTTLPGRFSVLRLPNGPLVVMDGAHNALAAEALAGPVAALRKQEKIQRLLLVVGMVGGHAPEDVLAPFAPQAARVYVCRPAWKRALPAEEVAEIACRLTASVAVVPSVLDAVQAALADAGAGDMILITGSFYTVGEAPPDRIQKIWRSFNSATLCPPRV